MITIVTYRKRTGLFNLVFVFALTGCLYISFSNYFTVLPAHEEGNHGSYLYENNQSVENSTHQRTRTQVVTFQTTIAGFESIVPKNRLHLVISLARITHPGPFQYLISSHKALLLFCRLIL